LVAGLAARFRMSGALTPPFQTPTTVLPMHALLRSLPALFCAVLFLGACVAPGRESGVVQEGLLGPGASISGSSSVGSSWSLQVEGDDLVIRVDQARAVFAGVATTGGVRYRHAKATEHWTFLFGETTAEWSGTELISAGESYTLEGEASYAFDETGRPEVRG
jgi:hypothetical protein